MTTTDILARLKAATGPDRVIDLYIMAFENNATVKEVGGSFILVDNDDTNNSLDVGHPSWPRSGIPEITASIDASIALVERMLPGCRGDMHWGGERPMASILRDDDARPYFSGATPALAILTALFGALTANETGETK